MSTTPEAKLLDHYGITSAQVTAAARALNRLSAQACNVDPEDNWTLYCEDFKHDARLALIAAASAVPQPPAVEEPCYCDREGIGEPGVSCGDCPRRDYVPAVVEALRLIANQDPVELMLDPQWAQRIARAALGGAHG